MPVFSHFLSSLEFVAQKRAAFVDLSLHIEGLIPYCVYERGFQEEDLDAFKIGSDGRSEIERQETAHNCGDKHTNPHDSKIDWNNPDEHPVPGSPINYPNGAPDFNQYVRTFSMDNYIFVPDGSMNFETISEFKQSLS